MASPRWASATALMASNTRDSYATAESAHIHEVAKNAAKLKAAGSGSLAASLARAIEGHCMRELQRLGAADEEYDSGFTERYYLRDVDGD